MSTTINPTWIEENGNKVFPITHNRALLGGLSYKAYNIDDTVYNNDWNNVKDNGFYYDNSGTNRPPVGINTYPAKLLVEVVKINSGTVMQRLVMDNTEFSDSEGIGTIKDVYSRIGIESSSGTVTWGSWYVSNTESLASRTYVENTGSTATVRTITINGITSLDQIKDKVIFIKSLTTGSASATTININSLGAKQIRINRNSGLSTSLISGWVRTGQVYSVSYDGTYFNVLSGGDKSENYLPLSGGTMTGPISTAEQSTWLNGYKGTDAIINSTSTGSQHTTLWKKNSTNGVFIIYSYNNGIGFSYQDKSSIDSSSNASKYNITMTEEGSFIPSSNNSQLLGGASNKWANVYATTFTGNLTGTASNATIWNSQQLTSQDLDNYNSNSYGKTYYAPGGNTVQNKPSGVGAFGMQVYRTATGHTMQILMSTETNKGIYYRGGPNTNLGEWQNITGGSGSGGHTILNSSGVAMTQRSKLRFNNATVTDDANNDVTIITPTGTSGNYLPLSGGKLTGNVTPTTNNTLSLGTSALKFGTMYATTFYGALSGNASTATKLANARTINGTSFNGSANITTTNWGTARNIGIVNSDGTGTAVVTSVNGSANVNLKLPATIKAALSGNATSATQVKVTETSPSSSTAYRLVFTDATATTNTANMRINNVDAQIVIIEGTASAEGQEMISLGNATATGTAGNKRGYLRLYSANTGYDLLRTSSHTGSYNHDLPNHSGLLVDSSNSSVTNVVSLTQSQYNSQKNSLPNGTIVNITDSNEAYVTTQSSSITCDLPLDL